MARIAAAPPGEERRQQIMEAGLRVFALKGYAGATIKDVTAEAGVTSGLLYHYFEDKHALLRAIFAEHSPLAGTFVGAQLAGADEGDARAVLTRLVTTLLARLEGDGTRAAFRLLLGEAMHDPEMAALFKDSMARAVETLAAYLRTQAERGRLRRLDPTLCAQFLLGGLMSYVMRRSCLGDPVLAGYSAEAVAATLVELAMDGLEARAPCRRQAEA